MNGIYKCVKPTDGMYNGWAKKRQSYYRKNGYPYIDIV